MNETEVLLMRQAALRTASLFLCMMLFLIPAAEAEQKLAEGEAKKASQPQLNIEKHVKDVALA